MKQDDITESFEIVIFLKYEILKRICNKAFKKIVNHIPPFHAIKLEFFLCLLGFLIFRTILIKFALFFLILPTFFQIFLATRLPG